MCIPCCSPMFLHFVPVHPTLTVCRCNILEAYVFITACRPSRIDFDKESLSFREISHCQWWMAEDCEEACTVVVDHKLRSSRCTQTTVSSHHSQRPQGLECACEWGAYFVFLSPDSHPWGTFHPEMCSLLFSAPLCERRNHQEALNWKTYEWHQINLRFHKLSPPSYYRAQTDQPTQYLFNK